MIRVGGSGEAREARTACERQSGRHSVSRLVHRGIGGGITTNSSGTEIETGFDSGEAFDYTKSTVVGRFGGGSQDNAMTR